MGSSHVTNKKNMVCLGIKLNRKCFDSFGIINACIFCLLGSGRSWKPEYTVVPTLTPKIKCADIEGKCNVLPIVVFAAQVCSLCMSKKDI